MIQRTMLQRTMLQRTMLQRTILQRTMLQRTNVTTKSFFISVINQFDAKLLFYNKFISCLYMFQAHVLIIRKSKLHYTASGIITPIGGRLVHETCRGMK